MPVRSSLFLLVSVLLTTAGTSGPITAQPFALTTTYDADLGGPGNMFEVRARQDVTITGFDVNLWTGRTEYTLEVYVKVGSYLGHEHTPEAWTRLGTATNVTSRGNDRPPRCSCRSACRFRPGKPSRSTSPARKTG